MKVNAAPADSVVHVVCISADTAVYALYHLRVPEIFAAGSIAGA
jgi:hypothetical protein